jgi:hypothetical protein
MSIGASPMRVLAMAIASSRVMTASTLTLLLSLDCELESKLTCELSES